MTAIDMALGLRADIEAQPGTIRAQAMHLETLRARMLGRAHDVSGQFTEAAGEFTDLIAWDIQDAGAQELASWEAAAGALTSGAAVLRLWADDIDDYRTKRRSIQGRWEETKQAAQAQLSSVTGSITLPGVVPFITSTALNEEAVLSRLAETKAELRAEHDRAWDDLMEEADERKRDLREGPSAETVHRLLEAGHLGWRHLSHFGLGVEGPLPVDAQSGEQAARDVAAWQADPEGFEGRHHRDPGHAHRGGGAGRPLPAQRWPAQPSRTRLPGGLLRHLGGGEPPPWRRPGRGARHRVQR